MTIPERGTETKKAEEKPSMQQNAEKEFSTAQ